MGDGWQPRRLMIGVEDDRLDLMMRISREAVVILKDERSVSKVKAFKRRRPMDREKDFSSRQDAKVTLHT